MSEYRRSDYEASSDRELYLPPKHPFKPLPGGRSVDTSTGEIVILEPAVIKAEPHTDAAERMAPLRATLASLRPAAQELRPARPERTP